MQQNYDKIIEQRAERVFSIMKLRVASGDLDRLRAAFNLARKAHASQKRKTGEPYILHPIAVATIAAEELNLGTNPVIACFLHDVVEDTDYTLEDIERRFGEDVAFLVKVVTKQKKDKYEMSKQLDNFKQMLVSVQYDIRALLVKLADRLHNMRTLSSMRPDKQMKIAGETDYFYAPLANRLGLYTVKTELENLSFRFRCPHEYNEISTAIARDEAFQRERLGHFCDDIRAILRQEGIHAEVYVEYRKPYSLWRKMHKFGDDFNHLKYRHFTEVVFETPQDISEKNMALKIYSMLTDRFKEKPGGISNYIDSPKENGYQSFHVKLLADFGRWQEVHISSRRMVRDSQLGCVAERHEDNIARWIEKFRSVLRDVAGENRDGGNFIEKVVTSFYNDDIMAFTPKGQPVIMPQRSTVLDFAYDISDTLGNHAKCARINNQLASVKTRLHRGDVVEIITSDDQHPADDWMQHVLTYKAKKGIEKYFDELPVPVYNRCHHCNPMPGEEVVGFREADGRVTIHKRDCATVIRLATQQGDNIVSVNFESDGTLYPVTVKVRAVDRVHLFVDLVDSITNEFNLSIDSIHADTTDSIVTFEMSFSVHSFGELQAIMRHIGSLDGVDEVRRVENCPS